MSSQSSGETCLSLGDFATFRANVERALLVRGSVDWDSVPTAVEALREVESLRKWALELFQGLLDHVDGQEELRALCRWDDKGKGKAIEMSPPQSLREKLCAARWKDVAALLGREDDTAGEYWELARHLRERHIVNHVLNLGQESAELAANYKYASQLLEQYFPPQSPPVPLFHQSNWSNSAQRAATYIEWADWRQQHPQIKSSKKRVKYWKQCLACLSERRDQLPSKKLISSTKSYLDQATALIERVSTLNDAVRAWHSWFDALEEPAEVTDSDATSEGEEDNLDEGSYEDPQPPSRQPSPTGLQPPTEPGPSQRLSQQNPSQSTSQNTRSTLSYVNPSPPELPQATMQSHSQPQSIEPPPPPPQTQPQSKSQESVVAETSFEDAVQFEAGAQEVDASPAPEPTPSPPSKPPTPLRVSTPPSKPTNCKTYGSSRRFTRRTNLLNPKSEAPSPATGPYILHVRPMKRKSIQEADSYRDWLEEFHVKQGIPPSRSRRDSSATAHPSPPSKMSRNNPIELTDEEDTNDYIQSQTAPDPFDVGAGGSPKHLHTPPLPTQEAHQGEVEEEEPVLHSRLGKRQRRIPSSDDDAEGEPVPKKPRSKATPIVQQADPPETEASDPKDGSDSTTRRQSAPDAADFKCKHCGRLQSEPLKSTPQPITGPICRPSGTTAFEWPSSDLIEALQRASEHFLPFTAAWHTEAGDVKELMPNTPTQSNQETKDRQSFEKGAKPVGPEEILSQEVVSSSSESEEAEAEVMSRGQASTSSSAHSGRQFSLDTPNRHSTLSKPPLMADLRAARKNTVMSEGTAQTYNVVRDPRPATGLSQEDIDRIEEAKMGMWDDEDGPP